MGADAVMDAELRKLLANGWIKSWNIIIQETHTWNQIRVDVGNQSLANFGGNMPQFQGRGQYRLTLILEKVSDAEAALDAVTDTQPPNCVRI